MLVTFWAYLYPLTLFNALIPCLIPLTFIFWTIHKNLPSYCILIFVSKPMNSFRCHNFAVLNEFYVKSRQVQYCQAQVQVNPRRIANHLRSVLILGSKHNYNIRGKGQVKYHATATLASFYTTQIPFLSIWARH